MSQEKEPRPTPILFEKVVSGAKESTLKDGRHAPTLIADGSRQPLIMRLSVLAPDHHDRLRQMFFAGVVIAREQSIGRLRRAFFIAEGWMSVAHEGQPPDVHPSQDPERKEMLIISGYTPTTRHTDVALVEMLRDSQGRLRELKDFGPVEEREHSSPLLEAFVKGYFSGRRFR